MKAGTVSKVRDKGEEDIPGARGKAIRFWLTERTYVECTLNEGTLRVRGMSNRTGALLVYPIAGNVVEISVS